MALRSEAALDIEARLNRNGIDSADINAEVFVQTRTLFLLFDQLMHPRKAAVSGYCARSVSAVNLPRVRGGRFRQLIGWRPLVPTLLVTEREAFAGKALSFNRTTIAISHTLKAVVFVWPDSCNYAVFGQNERVMPHAGDWITAILYLSAAYSCRSAAKRIQPEHREALFWMSIAVLFLVLAVVDLFGLQSAVTELCRSIAMKQGWYSQRYGSQVAFIEIISALTAVMAFGLLFGARRISVQCMIALTFATLIVGYVVVRASSLHSVDALMARTVLGLHFNRIPEIAGIGIVLLASSTRA